ncbi:putative periplasmic serine endoprotease DegP-like precursor [bacterium BMS3Abin07]|nr:putative periplasmic serine endoprotease DegP-like precursor [bacterium BMS3Abin07]HDO22842.1 DegQ family serine endoprotease [Nitrospirota bacterium]
MKSRTKLNIFLFILIGLVIGLTMSSSFGIQEKTAAEQKAVSTESADFLNKLNVALSEISDMVEPAVVNISTEKTVRINNNPFDGFFNDPFFRRFFGNRGKAFRGPHEYKSRALGSGVIISDDGYILTNNHVVKDADKIKVLLFDKREFDGKVIGTDPKTDVAVIRIKARNLPVLKLGNSDKLKAGSLVIAVGNPYGLSHTVTMGIVSAVGRANVGIADYEDFIQTDAAINPGNSGGAMVNTRGELVGINTAIFSTTGGYQGIGFAIPSNMAKNVMESLIRHGKVVRGWLGVTIQDLTPELAKHFDIKAKKGVLVSDVVEKSPAEKAGMKRGDLIVAYDGKKVKNTFGFRNMVAETPPGNSVDISVMRDGKETVLNVKIGELPEKLMSSASGEGPALKGITVRDLTPDIRERLGISEKVNGVVVSGVAPDSDAYGKLMSGDIIREINRKTINNIGDYRKSLTESSGQKDILLLVYRKGAYIYLTISR